MIIQVAGILGSLAIPLYLKQTVVWPPTERPMSADLVEEVLDKLNIDALFLAPSIIEDLSQSQTSLEKLKRIKYVEFGGGRVVSITHHSSSSADI